MIFNQATDYGFRIVLALANKENTRVEAQEISSNQKIPERFLFKIMRSLVKTGIVKSYRGVKGGFMLGRDPDQITLLDVVEAIQGPVQINNCLLDQSACSRNATSYCAVHQELEQLREDMIARLGTVNFKTLMEREQLEKDQLEREVIID